MELKNRILKFSKDYITLFQVFKHVYLFGSALNSCNCQNDVDMLIIYDKYSREIEKTLKIIRNELEKSIELPIDLTVLSSQEEQETEFLEKIKHRCMKIK